MQDSSSLFVVVDHRTTRRVEPPGAAGLYRPVRRLVRRVRKGTSLVGVIAFIIYVTVAGLTASIAVANRNAHREATAARAAAAADAADARSTETPLMDPSTEPILLDGR